MTHPTRSRVLAALWLALPLALAAGQARAFGGTLTDWQARYGAQSASGDAAGCQLCHGNANGGSPWNAYGWDLRLALADAACDLDASGAVSNEEAFFCVERANSDGDGSGWENAEEIGLGTQPGWTEGPFNVLYFEASTLADEPPPAGIGPLDPDGTEPPPPPPPPPSEDEDCPRSWTRRRTLVVKPGESIQRAIDCARPKARIFVLPGVYREYGDATNALTVTRSGLTLIGLGGRRQEVVIENAGRQRNGIAVVPEDRADCMSCHSDLAPPFPTLPGVEGGLKMREPMMQGFEIRNVTIRGFTNGLFTENVDGLHVEKVRAIDNSGYGIFPTLSRNGVITRSYASGSDDSGIWVETSENFRVTHNLVEGNVNGFEVSNSDDVLLAWNVARHNSVGVANLLLPDIFDDRAGAHRITVRHNLLYDNNKENTARPGSILSQVPSGIGILHLGVDDSLIAHNWISGNDFVGIGLADYCIATLATDMNCNVDPTVTPEFVAASETTGNEIRGNVVLGNAQNPPGGLFGMFAADLTYLSTEANGNCYEGNLYETFSSFLGVIPSPDALPCD